MLTNASLRNVVQVGIELTAEKDSNRLLEKLLRTAMDITGCDGGTLYLLIDQKLYFKVMKTLSQDISLGENGEEIDLPPVDMREENVCAFAAIHRELVSIPDVYSSECFDFSGPRRYDTLTGYRTGSMLVVPLEDGDGELLGVLQLINKLNPSGTFISFTEEDAFILKSLGSMTAVSLSNMRYVQEIKAQMFSFVQAFATAVDERTPYNGTHTRKVTVYADLLAGYINFLHDRGETEEYFDVQRREQLILAAALHDIGKLIVPLSVMNKATRLGYLLPLTRQRYELLSVLCERDLLKGKISHEEYEHRQTDLRDGLALIEKADTAGFLSDLILDQIQKLAAKQYVREDGNVIPYLTAAELECLSIRKGTLTDAERRTMQSHASMTDKILQQVHFNRKYAGVRHFAATHHEYLNGTGYPNGLSAEDLPLETRIITVVDVFDALTCTDRPYKKPLPRPKAFAVLHEMAADGQIEGNLVSWLEAALENISAEDIDRMAAADGWQISHVN